MSNVTREPFDMWRTGWLSFVQVLLASVELSKEVAAGECGYHVDRFDVGIDLSSRSVDFRVHHGRRVHQRRAC